MSAHLGPAELLERAENGLGPRDSHVSTCPSCKERIDELRLALADARVAEVPEPSPLFWEHFSARVGRSIRTEVDARPRLGGWSWRLVAPGSLAALVVLSGVLATLPERQPARTEVAVPDTAAASFATDPAPADEASWQLFTELTGDVDPDVMDETGLEPAPAVVEDALLAALSEDEMTELVRLLKAETPARRVPSED